MVQLLWIESGSALPLALVAVLGVGSLAYLLSKSTPLAIRLGRIMQNWSRKRRKATDRTHQGQNGVTITLHPRAPEDIKFPGRCYLNCHEIAVFGPAGIRCLPGCLASRLPWR